MQKLLDELGFEHLPMMTEFLKEFGSRTQGVNNAPKYSEYKYMDFITQPLTKGMFVPTDKEGNVLEKPKELTEDDTDTIVDFMEEVARGHIKERPLVEYQLAMERVIFEGYEKDEIECLFSEDFEGKESYTVNNNGIDERYYTIEQAINAGVKLKLKP